MSPSPAERFSALLSRSGERGWSPDDDRGYEDDVSGEDGFGDDDGFEDDDAADEGGFSDGAGGRAAGGVRPGISRTLLLCLLGGVLTVVLVLVLAPSLLKGGNPLSQPAVDADWEAAHAAETAEPGGGAPDAQQNASSGSGDGSSQNGRSEAGGAEGGAGSNETGQGTDGTVTVVVHVVGAVDSPGVVDLPASSRVSDALDAAGGTVGDADVEALNLARLLVDGEQIRVPRMGEELVNDEHSGGGDPGGGGTQPGSAQSGGGPINLNTADITQLQTLAGIGPVTAQAIIDHRDTVGRFGSVDELLDVTGIGDATLGTIRESVTVG